VLTITRSVPIALLTMSLLTVSLLTGACSGGSSTTAAPAAAPANTSATAAPFVTLTDPPSGAFSGHIDSFRWSPVSGADGYRMKITSSDGRVVWESDLLTAAEVHLPASVSIEPEAYFWQVTAMKGASTLAVSAPSKFTVTP
jgi:hypothetical protein